MQITIPMDMFSHLHTDTALWDPTSITTWGSLDFCLPVQQFNVPTIKHAQLTTLSQAGAWGNAEKPWKDKAFLFIAPSLATWGQRVFGLVAMWVHPYQIHLASLAEATQCLVLVAEEGPDWPYTFVHMNDAVLHVLLSKPQRNPCSFLHQLQAWRLLQCGEWVACPGGLNLGP